MNEKPEMSDSEGLPITNEEAAAEALAGLMEVMDGIVRMGDPILKSNAIKVLDWADSNVQTKFGVKSAPGKGTTLYWVWRAAHKTKGGEQRRAEWKSVATKKDAIKKIIGEVHMSSQTWNTSLAQARVRLLSKRLLQTAVNSCCVACICVKVRDRMIKSG